MAKMIQCKTCSKEIASNAKSCPSCGAKNKKTIYKRPWFIVIAFFVIGGAIGGAGGGDSTTTDSGTGQEISQNQKADAKAKVAGKKPNDLSEAQYKAQCVDIPWKEVVKDRKTHVGDYLKKDLMVREIGTDSITDETVYICGENKGEGGYVGGTFTVYDRRKDKTRPIELYDKIYVYGQITGIFMTYSSYDPEFEVKYVQFNGKFGE